MFGMWKRISFPLPLILPLRKTNKPEDMATKYHMVLDDYPDHATALGRMLGHWGELETHLMRMTEFLFQVPHDHVNHHKTDFVYKEFVSLPSKIQLLERLNRWFVQDTSTKEAIKEL